MASLQWQHICSIRVSKDAIGIGLENILENIGFSISNSDIDSGFVFALANPNKKYAGESLSILISWSPKRLDGFLVEVRSKEPQKTNHRSRAELISDSLKKSLPKVFCGP